MCCKILLCVLYKGVFDASVTCIKCVVLLTRVKGVSKPPLKRSIRSLITFDACVAQLCCSFDGDQRWSTLTFRRKKSRSWRRKELYVPVKIKKTELQSESAGLEGFLFLLIPLLLPSFTIHFRRFRLLWKPFLTVSVH